MLWCRDIKAAISYIPSRYCDCLVEDIRLSPGEGVGAKFNTFLIDIHCIKKEIICNFSGCTDIPYGTLDLCQRHYFYENDND